MMGNGEMIAYGPVPSRRLGKSLGINNIPPKICTYSCIYCQLGKTLNMQTGREEFYKPQRILNSVKNKVKEAEEKKEKIDYLTFVPDGEPTLDVNLGEEIKLVKNLGVKIAVITNSSLIWKKEIWDDLSKADWVSVKIDAVTQKIWKKVNRPHKSLQLRKILEGISEFSDSFKGDLVTETMLIEDVNDKGSEIDDIADFISDLNARKSYISIPIRPPTERWVEAADEYKINRAYQSFKERGIDVEYLIGYEGNAFAFTGDVENDLLGITSVHPMRKEGVEEFLKKADADWSIVDKLISEKKLVKIGYKDNTFFMRKL